ncbi:MAG: NAD(P)/FAD-dependent oxidoreductase [Clostridia bacterium]|nr:NAD(P)/FAD-dependent oxidoreductase [Clostridia bacterium]
MSKKVAIIGAGIAGLSAGCYGQINGYETEIYEMHNIPGGLCTAWNRKGYTFDGCLHWLMGTRQDTLFFKYWDEIGALHGLRFHQHDMQIQMEDREGRKLTLYADIDKLEEQLLETAPEDSIAIRELTGAVRKFMNMKMSMDKPEDMYGFSDTVKMLVKMGPMLKDFAKLNKISIGQYVDKLKNPFLKEALPGIMPREYTLFVFVMVLATYANKDAGWPMGGSLEFARAIEKSYLKLGGKINYSTKVEKILVEDHKAVGIQLNDGSKHFADYVISAADGHSTIFKMLDGRYLDDNIQSLYREIPLAPTSVQVSLGVACDLSKEPSALGVKLEKPFNVGGIENSYFTFRHYCYDPSMAPEGKSSVTSLLYSDYEYWEKLYREDKNAYNAQKKIIADEYIRVFEERFPYAKGKVEVVDVSTPFTYTRYTGTWKGVYMSWMTTPQKPRLKVPGKLPKLKNFYLAGQWANSSGGVPVGVITGRWSLMRICKDDGKKFVAKKT